MQSVNRVRTPFTVNYANFLSSSSLVCLKLAVAGQGGGGGEETVTETVVKVRGEFYSMLHL